MKRMPRYTWHVTFENSEFFEIRGTSFFIAEIRAQQIKKILSRTANLGDIVSLVRKG